MSAKNLSTEVRLVKIIAFILCLSPLYEMLWFGVTARFGDYPSWEIIGITGEAALILLLITLSVTPIRRIFGWNVLLKLRRMFGLFTYFYASLHFIVYIWREDNFMINEFFIDVVNLPYITVGFIAWLLLTPMALTANDDGMKRLGIKWKQLHSMIYFIAFLSVLHYLLVRTWDTTDVLWYASILTFLLGYRFYHSRTIKDWSF